MERQSIQLRELTETVKATFPTFGVEVQPIWVQAIRALADGEPVPMAKIARAAGVSEEDVHRFFHERLSPGWSYFDDAGRLVGFWGLSILPVSPHRLQVDGQTLHAWCAWDTLFLPHILQRPADVRSVCPVTGKAIELRVMPERLDRAAPETAVMSFILADKQQIATDVVLNFCHRVHFFASWEAGREWQTQHTDSVLVAIEDAFVLGREVVGNGLGLALGSPAGSVLAPCCRAI